MAEEAYHHWRVFTGTSDGASGQAAIDFYDRRMMIVETGSSKGSKKIPNAPPGAPAKERGSRRCE
jgi:hypothetical protein